MTARRFFLFAGDTPMLCATGAGATAYNGGPRSGDVLLLNGNTDYHWTYRHLSNNLGIGVLAYIWNRIGGGSAANPVPSVDTFHNPLLLPNGFTDPVENGAYPSAWLGVEGGFLLGAHGYPYDAGKSGPLSRDLTFSTQHRSFGLELIPQKETRGLVVSVTQDTGTTILVTLSSPHGAALGSTFTAWMYGFRPSSQSPPDPQLTGKFTATAHASDASSFYVTLATPWTGKAGRPATGVAITPEYRITALSNPSGNTVRVTMSKPFPGTSWDSLLYNASAAGDFWLGDVTGTASDINGMWNVLWNGAGFHKTVSASTLVSFTSGTKTIALSAGSWARTPVAGEKLYITGTTSGANNKVVTVVSATSSTIVVSETLTTQAAGPAVTIHTLHILEFNYGSVPNLAGWNSDGFVFRQDKAHPVFADDCGGELYIGRIRTEVAQFIANAHAVVLTGPIAGDTIGDSDSAVVCSFGDADLGAASDGSNYQQFCLQAWPQTLVDVYRGVRAAAAEQLDGTIDPDALGLIQLPTRIDKLQEDAVATYAGYSDSSIFFLKQAEAWAVTQVAKATSVSTPEIPPSNGQWPYGVECIRLGMAAWESNVALNTEAATLAAIPALPVYIYLGQSQDTGAPPASATQPQPVYSGGDPDMNGSWYDAAYSTVLRRRGCDIWHWGRNRPEEYAPVLNGVSWSDRLKARWPVYADLESVAPLGSVVGPEVTMLPLLRGRHPEGVVLFKHCVPGASLQYINEIIPAFAQSAGDLWLDIVEWWGRFRTWCYQNGRVPDVRGIVFSHGEGDSTATSTYADALTTFIADLRALLTTSSSSRSPIPVVLGMVQTHDRNSPAWATALVQIQDAQKAVAASVPNVRIASMQDLPISDDNVHRTFHGVLVAGERMARAFDETSIGTDGPTLETVLLNPGVLHDAGTIPTGSSGGGSTTSLTPGDSGGSASDVSASFTTAGSPAEIARQVVALCDQAIADGLTVLSYTVNGRTFTRSGLSEILRTRAVYAAVLARVSGTTRRQGAFS